MNAIVVLSVDGYIVPRKVLDSYSHAAKRWGCEFVQLKEPTCDKHPFWQKLLVHRCVKEFHQVLQLDLDMLIRFDAPNPFSYVEEDEFGVVAARQDLHDDKERMACVKKWEECIWLTDKYKHIRDNPCPDTHHMNAGFMLYSPRLAGPLLDEAYDLGDILSYDHTGCPEQSILSILLYNHEYRVKWLPWGYNANRIGSKGKRIPYFNAHGNMSCWIYHFAPGPRKWKPQRVRQCHWKFEKPDFARFYAQPKARHGRCIEICKRFGADQKIVGAEVGVCFGQMSVDLLAHLHGLHLYMVDKWSPNERDTLYWKSHDPNARMSADEYSFVMHKAMTDTMFASERRTILQLDFYRASQLFPIGYFDFVFLDADHTYEGTKDAILEWEGRVKRGGWLCGHDYGRTEQRWGVRRAVEDTIGTDNLQLGRDLTWFKQM